MTFNFKISSFVAVEVQQPQEAALKQIFLLLLRGRIRRHGPRNA